MENKDEEWDFNLEDMENEDKEWVAKMHTQRPLYFEPPSYKKFLKYPAYGFVSLYDIPYCIVIDNDIDIENECARPKEDWIIVIHNHHGEYIFEVPFNEENYIKTIEFARKLFLEGEE